MSESDKVFAGSIPELYESHLVPLIFESYAIDLAKRIAALAPNDILETAAGTGVVTRALAGKLGSGARYIVTDLNQPMLDHAASKHDPDHRITWQTADALDLPFEDESFDVVACQFGVMFFPDKSKAFSEARRVLKPGGIFIFNVWDRISENEFADTVTTALEAVFPRDPPRFLARTPHGYHDVLTIAQDLANAGFTNSPQIATVEARSRAKSARVPAIAYCQGTPLRNEIEARDISRLAGATDIAAAAVAQRFGAHSVDGKIQAHVVTVKK